ncbi:uncharacterized protein LOC132803798 [Ziziphus jujuba]|uniref:Uncharacterized protein LOC132803798 n=1 Tax=Ziziphus jujuba TaxID=326968 RepID=A0ABM4A9B0_ZIZJJ|nr:uncharacterized protein LOC132803798 [Ziziphus jujuba]
MIRLRTESVRELSKDAFRTLDIASALGHIEIVKEIMLRSTGTARKQVCGLKGEGRTAIHYAAINGKVEVMDELFIASAESFGETALHLAVKYRFEAFKKFIEWMEFLGLEELVNCGDEDGYTVVHLANVQLLLSCNSKIAQKLERIQLISVFDKSFISNAGAANAQLQHVAINVANNQEHGPIQPSPSFQMDPDVVEDEKKQDGIKYLRFQTQRDSPSDTMFLPVVAALIAAVTFHAGVKIRTEMAASEMFLLGDSLGLSASVPSTTFPNIGDVKW